MAARQCGGVAAPMGVIATFNIAKRMPAATGAAAAAGAAAAVDVAVAPTFVLCPLSVLPSFLQATRRDSEVATGTETGTEEQERSVTWRGRAVGI